VTVTTGKGVPSKQTPCAAQHRLRMQPEYQRLRVYKYLSDSSSALPQLASN
jgi:hypothetical protein